MAGTYDNEQKRIIDRIKCITLLEAKGAGAEFINGKWISEKLGRSIAWVGQWWNRIADECFVDYDHTSRPLKMSQESQAIVLRASHKQRKSRNAVAREILEFRGKRVSEATVRRLRHREGLKPFHVIARPLKTETSIEDRLWLYNLLTEWTEADFLHLVPSDKFFIWPIRKPNHQNDRIWSKNIEDIEEDDRYRELVKNPVCVGIFIIFTAKKLHWVIKER
jgi:transposase